MTTNNLNKIKVLVVDDSAFMRKIISDMLNYYDDIVVIDTARNGQDAIEKISRLKPDIVTMDIEMPILDGLSALKIIMETNPLPIIMLSSLTKEGAEATVKALEIGALEFLPKPSNVYNFNAEDLRQELYDKIKAISKVRTYNKNIQFRSPIIERNREVVLKPRPGVEKDLRVVAIGTSTGGPKALQEVLPYIPKGYGLSIFVVQHMPPGFTKSLAERLNSLSEIKVKEAEDREYVQPDTAYIAPGDYHMTITKDLGGKLMINLDKSPTVSGHRPSVNVMMESISNLNLKAVTGVIMTGMGSDGYEGLKKIKASTKCQIIAQSEESCIVYGMPKAVVNGGIADKISDLSNIAREIIKSVEV